MNFEEVSEQLGCVVTSEAQAKAIVVKYAEALKKVNSLGLQLSSDTIRPHQSAPYLETIVSQWNKAFNKFGLNYGLQIREFNNVTTFVFCDYSTNTMLSGKSILDVLNPSILIRICNGASKGEHDKNTARSKQVYGVMKRKDFAGDPLNHPDYLGEKVYRGKVSGNYLTDNNGKRHAINSRYVTGFKLFDSVEKMKEFKF